MNLRVMFFSFILAMGMMSCNQTISDNANDGGDSTQVESSEITTPNVENTAAPEVSNFDGNYKIVYINTDSLVSQYKFFIDGNEKMILAKNTMRNQLESKSKKLQKEYEEYMRQGKAGMLTLKQQQDTEASLTQQQQDLVELEKSLTERLMMQEQVLNRQINDTVAAFIDAYRIEKGYTLILQQQTLNGVLAADPALDITIDVISRLNAKYDFDMSH